MLLNSLAVDASSFDILGAELSMANVLNAEAPPDLLRPLRRNSDRVTGDGTYDTHSYCVYRCHQETMPYL